MTQIVMKPKGKLARPLCDRCGGKTKLFGIEAHPTHKRADLRTFVCTQCEAIQIDIVARRR
jgi:hypothetical protein